MKQQRSSILYSMGLRPAKANENQSRVWETGGPEQRGRRTSGAVEAVILSDLARA